MTYPLFQNDCLEDRKFYLVYLYGDGVDISWNVRGELVRKLPREVWWDEELGRFRADISSLDSVLDVLYKGVENEDEIKAKKKASVRRTKEQAAEYRRNREKTTEK